MRLARRVCATRQVASACTARVEQRPQRSGRCERAGPRSWHGEPPREPERLGGADARAPERAGRNGDGAELAVAVTATAAEAAGAEAAGPRGAGADGEGASAEAAGGAHAKLGQEVKLQMRAPRAGKYDLVVYCISGAPLPRRPRTRPAPRLSPISTGLPSVRCGSVVPDGLGVPGRAAAPSGKRDCLAGVLSPGSERGRAARRLLGGLRPRGAREAARGRAEPRRARGPRGRRRARRRARRARLR